MLFFIVKSTESLMKTEETNSKMYSSLRDSFVVVSFEMISRKGKEKGEEKDKERKR